jgi:cytoskeletal protein RodZ
VSIGAVLADARWRSHLTVSEVSRETRIREAIIWGIEKDDFAACGGDAYARGHIRAIAHAVGTDPDPLIQEYDATVRTVEDIEELVVLRPGAAARTLRRRRLARTALGLAVLAIVGWAAYHFATAAGHAPGGKAVAAADRSGSHHAASDPVGAAPVGAAPVGAAPAGAAPAGPGTARPSPTSTPSPAPAPTHSTAAPAPPAVPVQVLTPVKAAAFGPGGTKVGDNPQHAAAVIDGSHATAWRSDWYTTAAFGNLKPGTGLLLDMGRRVTITSAQIVLGGIRGADVQLRAGNVPVLADLREVASAAGAGGTVRMWPHAAVRAKYVLIWFTRLPPDAAGTFQASVYDVHLHGHS